MHCMPLFLARALDFEELQRGHWNGLSGFRLGCRLGCHIGRQRSTSASNLLIQMGKLIMTVPRHPGTIHGWVLIKGGYDVSVEHKKRHSLNGENRKKSEPSCGSSNSAQISVDDILVYD